MRHASGDEPCHISPKRLNNTSPRPGRGERIFAFAVAFDRPAGTSLAEVRGEVGPASPGSCASVALVGEFLKTLGCTDGINLDGGGSACLMSGRGRTLAPVFPKGGAGPWVSEPPPRGLDVHKTVTQRGQSLF